MKSWLKWVVLFPIVLLPLTSCGLFKRIPVEINHRDSVSVTYKDSTIIRDSVVYVKIPKEEIINVVLPNQKSTLSTSLAESTAFTDSLGFLHHSLKNKSNEKIPVIVQNLEKYHTAQAVKSKSDNIIRTIQVEKRLNWWQKFRLKSFWWLLGLLILENVLLIFAINKRFIIKI